MGFEALKDLATALHISDKDITYQGTLAIAFGARGSGNAAAHMNRSARLSTSRKCTGPDRWHMNGGTVWTIIWAVRWAQKDFLSDSAHLYPSHEKTDRRNEAQNGNAGTSGKARGSAERKACQTGRGFGRIPL